MPRRRGIKKKAYTPDPKFNDVVVSRFVNYVMRKGKKSVAVFGATVLAPVLANLITDNKLNRW